VIKPSLRQPIRKIGLSVGEVARRKSVDVEGEYSRREKFARRGMGRRNEKQIWNARVEHPKEVSGDRKSARLVGRHGGILRGADRRQEEGEISEERAIVPERQGPHRSEHGSQGVEPGKTQRGLRPQGRITPKGGFAGQSRSPELGRNRTHSKGETEE